MTPLTVLQPDGVALVQSILTGLLPAPVVGRVPNPRPDRFTVVRLNGGIARTVTFDDRIWLQHWSATDEQCFADAALCLYTLRSARGSTVDGITVPSVRSYGTPSNVGDLLTGSPRLDQWVSFTTRGTDP